MRTLGAWSLPLAALLLAIPGSSLAEPAAGAGGAPAPVRIETLDVVDREPGAEVRLNADGPLVWTQYRDAAGNLIVELPNSVVASSVDRAVAGRGLLDRVDVESEPNGERPLTRLVLRTHGESEHTLLVEDQSLLVVIDPLAPPREEGRIASAAPLVPVGVGQRVDQATVVEDENLAESESFEPSGGYAAAPANGEMASAEMEPAPVAVPAVARATPRGGFGTAQQPLRSEEPTGVVASRLLGVEVVEIDGETVLRVLGDGEFAYSTFELSGPPRFVVDLRGVVNTSARSTVDVESPYVDQVRMAQFSPYPEPVARVVFDLHTAAAPRIDRGADGLWIRFGADVTPEPERMAEADLDQDFEAAAPDPAPSAQDDLYAEDVRPGATDELMEEVPATESFEPVEPLTPSVVAPAESLSEPSEEELVEESAPLAQPAMEPEPAPYEERSGREEETPELVIAQVDGETRALPGTVAVDSEEFEQDPPPALPPSAEPLDIDDPSRLEVPRYRDSTDVDLYRQDQVTIDPDSGETFGVQRLGQQERWTGDPITLSLKDADITEVLRTIARTSGLNMVIQPGVSGPVTVQMELVPWDQALDQILKVNNLGMQVEGNILRVAPIDQLQAEARAEQELARARALSQPLVTVLKRISYADASDIARVLTRGQRSRRSLGRYGLFEDSGLLSARGSISVDRRTNTLIIQELPDYLDTVIQVVQNLDIPEKQVMIEARIVETTRTFSRTLGVSWSVDGVANAALGNTTGLEFPNNIDASGGVQLLRGAQNGFINLALGNVLNSFQLDLALTAAEAEGLVNVVSAPKVATLNNEQAEIQTGLQIPVQTVVNNTVTVVFINATLRLNVEPQVTAEGTILMDIEIQKREPQLALAVVGATNAPIATREARTRVIVRDGGTAVIGGIYTVTTNEGADRVPGLANIPILGALFRNKIRESENQELLIFITPRVIQL